MENGPEIVHYKGKVLLYVYTIEIQYYTKKTNLIGMRNPGSVAGWSLVILLMQYFLCIINETTKNR